uniref:Neur_chan_LBD domain-containing protein n=1 Tax=Angiostrongylus cantonensis TaxID=6313 RepID=A0A158P5T2_ANGCA
MAEIVDRALETRYWIDEFLQWSPSSYDGATEIFLSSSDIWIPEFSLYYRFVFLLRLHSHDQFATAKRNMMDRTKLHTKRPSLSGCLFLTELLRDYDIQQHFSLFSLNFNDAVKLQSNNDIRVNYTGHVRYYIPFSSESLCKLDVKFFPFDTQQCTLLFGSWAHSNDSIKYSLYTPKLSLIDFYDNQEWELDTVRSTVKSDGFLYDYLDPPLFWEMIIIDLVVERQSFYYVFNLVIPSTIITLVAVIGFHTPSTSGRMRDAKFRLGIMTLMSMSVILLAIVEDMPKFSMSSNRRGRGSFSGIPLIGLYYFILLAIIGLSTVTTSMFVFLERDVRAKRNIPWYLHWLSFDVLRARTERSIGQYRRNQRDPQTEEATPPRINLRRRLSLAQYDNMVLYQYFEQVLEDIITCAVRIEKAVCGIRQDVISLKPYDDLNSKWQTVIRRLEIISLVFYVSVLFITMYLFFYHEWYCAVGHNPCGQMNLKCPWMVVTPDDPQCDVNPYN